MDRQEIEIEFLKLRDAIRKEVMQEVNATLDREAKANSARISLYLGVGKWIGAFAIGLLALLGFNKWNDITRSVKEEYLERLERRFSIHEPGNEISVSLEKLKNKAIVNSLTIKAVAKESDGYQSGPPASISKVADLNAVRAMLLDPETATQELIDAVQALDYISNDGEEREKSGLFLSKLIFPKGSLNAPALNNDKIKAILYFERASAVYDSAIKLLKLDRNDELSESSIMILDRAGYRPAAKELISYFTSADSKAKKVRATIALAGLSAPGADLQNMIKWCFDHANEDWNGVIAVSLADRITRTIERDIERGAGSKQVLERKLIEEVVPLISRFVKSQSAIAFEGAHLVFAARPFKILSLNYLYRQEVMGALLESAKRQSNDELYRYIHKFFPSRMTSGMLNIDQIPPMLFTYAGINTILKTGKGEVINGAEIDSAVRLTVEVPEATYDKAGNQLPVAVYRLQGRWRDSNGTDRFEDIVDIKHAQFTVELDGRLINDSSDYY
jgi:hypothetical protein